MSSSSKSSKASKSKSPESYQPSLSPLPPYISPPSNNNSNYYKKDYKNETNRIDTTTPKIGLTSPSFSPTMSTPRMSPVASSGDDNETNGPNFPGGLKKVHKVGIGAIVIEEVMRIEGTKEADIEKRGVPSVSNKPSHGTPAPPQSRRSPPTPQAHKEVRMHPHTNTSGVPSGMYSPKGRTVWSRRPPTSGASGGSGGGGGGGGRRSAPEMEGRNNWGKGEGEGRGEEGDEGKGGGDRNNTR